MLLLAVVATMLLLETPAAATLVNTTDATLVNTTLQGWGMAEPLTVAEGSAANVTILFPNFHHGIYSAGHPNGSVLFRIPVNDSSPTSGSMSPPFNASLDRLWMAFRLNPVQVSDAGLYTCMFQNFSSATIYVFQNCGRRLIVEQCQIYE